MRDWLKYAYERHVAPTLAKNYIVAIHLHKQIYPNVRRISMQIPRPFELNMLMPQPLKVKKENKLKSVCDDDEVTHTPAGLWGNQWTFLLGRTKRTGSAAWGRRVHPA